MMRRPNEINHPNLFDEPFPRLDMLPSASHRPKIDLHRHLLGCITTDIALKLANKHELSLPVQSTGELNDLLTVRNRVNGLEPFFRPWRTLSRLLVKPEVVEDVVLAALQEAHKDNVVYCEFRVAWGMTGREPFGIHDFLAAAAKGVAAAKKETGVVGRLVLGITRHLFARHAPDHRQRLWATILAAACEWRGILVVGFDLSGIENGYSALLYKNELLAAKDAGFPITIHAGETSNSDEIWHVVREIRPRRLGHGLAAARDTMLLQHLAEQEIAIEVCPTVNWLTRTIEGLNDHPAIRMQEANVPIVVGTDNPAICATTLTRELAVVREVMGFSENAMVNIERNSKRYMFAECGEVFDRTSTLND